MRKGVTLALRKKEPLGCLGKSTLDESHHEGEIVVVCRWPLVFLPAVAVGVSARRRRWRFSAPPLVVPPPSPPVELPPPSGAPSLSPSVAPSPPPPVAPPSPLLFHRRRLLFQRRRFRCFFAAAATCCGASSLVLVMAEEIAPKTDVAIDAGIAPKSENLPVQVTPICLTKDNYLSWSAALEIGITSRGRLPYITGDKPAPSKTDPQWANWKLEDSQVKVWIISSVSADIQPLILRKPTSFEMWNVLARMYGRKKRVL
ncbi:hypothetical protein EJ110_NYTH42985, partial [Nymphaea thermarum]